MYKVNIPFKSKLRSEKEWEISISELKRAKADGIYLIYDRFLLDDKKKQRTKSIFEDNKKMLETAGFEVYAWVVPTIGYGSLANETEVEAAKKYRKIMGVHGKETNAFCPLDDDFCKDLYTTFSNVAKTGVKRILLEDEFTLTGGKLPINSIGCCCDTHMKKLCEILGEDISREKLAKHLTEGKPNKYREAFFKLSEQSLIKVAKGIEKAVHDIDPQIRIGMSANSASYHIEGADFVTLCKTVAGNTKPFARLTGAPYWKDNAPNMNSVIETIRGQSVWCANEGIECMTEGDTYPRPRFIVPASHLEMYDMILRADKNTDSILKYMHDYNSKDNYETGYIDNHVENAGIYEEIEKRFKGSTVGLKVYETPYSISEMDFDETFPYMAFADHGILPLISQWLVTDCSVPTTYGSAEGASLVFGQNAKSLTESDIKGGLILDIAAAKILMEKGVDVGFTNIEEAPKPSGEYFIEQDDIICAATEREGGFFRITPNPEAKVLSEFYCSFGSLIGTTGFCEAQDRYPACYMYENKKGQRFMVYTFAATCIKTKCSGYSGLFRNYYRQSQLIEGYKWLCGRKLPAVCKKAPYLYIICKREEEKLHIGLFNISADKIYNPVIEVEKEYKSADFYNCTGRIEGENVVLEETILPYSVAFITLS
ncbi:MAG: hypothetical protein E7394_03225 [Ruminococcaceae bacterium]|nr:hypothetical protein [Oscillospiraceae bacterium]